MRPRPATVYALADLHPAGGLAGALRAGAGRVHLVPPDGHLARSCPGSSGAPWSAAVRRACGQSK